MLLTQRARPLVHALHQPLKVFDPDAIPFLFFSSVLRSPYITVSLLSPTFRHYPWVNKTE